MTSSWLGRGGGSSTLHVRIPFLKVKADNNNNENNSAEQQPWSTWHLVCLSFATGLLLAFPLGVAAGHVYWRRVRNRARRARARVGQWAGAARDEVADRWDVVVARWNGALNGALAGWHQGGGGGDSESSSRNKVREQNNFVGITTTITTANGTGCHVKKDDATAEKGKGKEEQEDDGLRFDQVPQSLRPGCGGKRKRRNAVGKENNSTYIQRM